MTTETVSDNRRTVVRVLTMQTMRGLRDLALIHQGDLIRALVFTAITDANTRHLTAADGRYASLYDLPPDRERRPVGLDELVEALLMPRDIVVRYISILVDEGICDERPTGYVIPSAVFTRPEMVDGLNEFYTGTMRLVSALRGAGFRVGEGR